MNARIAVVGAGWSGLAAAITLIDAGHRVTLIDAAPQTGGRARRVRLTLGDRAYDLDNGQHLLVGAYGEYLTLARRLGVNLEQRFLVQPFALRYPDGFTMVALRAPAPLHLAGALLLGRGLSWSDRWAAARWVRTWERRRWTLDQDRPASTLLTDHPARLTQRLWAPLCLAALNVRLEQASARIFLRVLGDSLGADTQASHLYLARGDLSTLLPDAAERAIGAAHGEVLLREPVLGVGRDDTAGWRVSLRARAVDADAVVLALPPARSAPLLRTIDRPALAEPIARLEAIANSPIATVYLRYPAGTRLARPVFALDENLSRHDYGQWVFDRGQLDDACDGVLSVVISGAGPHEDFDANTLAAHVARQVGSAFGLRAPLAHAVIVEKRATIVPSVGLVRPPVRGPMRGLYLASDSADSPYPSTLEGSVRTGLAAARAAIDDLAVSGS